MFRVKICGVTDAGDASLAAAAGADAVGINFYPGSLRYVPPEHAGPVVRAVRDGGATPVGVFVNENPETIGAVCSALGIPVVQLSGEEPPEEAARISLRRIKAVRILSAEGADAYRGYPCETLLLDAAAPGAYGGTGLALDWGRFKGLDCGRPWILAGGLNPRNVAEAIRLARPGGVDVASGVEKAPREKDGEMMRLFVASALKAFRDCGEIP